MLKNWNPAQGGWISWQKHVTLPQLDAFFLLKKKAQVDDDYSWPLGLCKCLLTPVIKIPGKTIDAHPIPLYTSSKGLSPPKTLRPRQSPFPFLLGTPNSAMRKKTCWWPEKTPCAKTPWVLPRCGPGNQLVNGVKYITHINSRVVFASFIRPFIGVIYVYISYRL